MPKVNVEQEIEGKPKNVYSAVKEYLNARGTLEKLGGSVVWDDTEGRGSIEAKNFSGSIEITANGENTSLVQIEIDLPFLLSPIKGKVKEELSKHLQRVKA